MGLGVLVAVSYKMKSILLSELYDFMLSGFEPRRGLNKKFAGFGLKITTSFI
jgi:hypothetical protein